MPTGWFTEPVRAWWPDFRSDLCTPGHPLCILTLAAIYADKRAEGLQRLTKRNYHFRRVDGRIGGTEQIWLHLRANGGTLTIDAATEMVGCAAGHLHQLIHAALSARVLEFKRGPGGGLLSLGPVMPKETTQ